MKKVPYILLILALIPLLGWAECLSWQAPTESFDGGALSSRIEQFEIYIGGAADWPTMTHVGTRLTTEADDENTVYTWGSNCNSLGLQPHDWACVIANYPSGSSECAFVERNPPGKSKNVKVGR